MSTSVKNSSQDLESIEENGRNRSEMIPVNDCDLSEVPKDYKNLIAFFLLGICNTFLFYITIVLQAKSFYHSAMFLVSIPIVIVKISPMFISAFMNTRVIIWIVFNLIGIICNLISVSSDNFEYFDYGSIFIVLSFGFGEVICLSYSANFEKHVIAAFSVGQGLGTFLCFILIELINITSKHHTILWVSLFLLVPIGQGVSYYVLLKSERIYVQKSNGITQINEHETSLTGFIQKICYIPKLLKYIVPLAVMYFLLLTSHQFLFHINEKLQMMMMDELLENVFSPELSNSHLVSSFGIFIGSLTILFLRIESIWHLVAIQVLNIAYLIIEHFFLILASPWILYLLYFWVSCLVGCAYVNTFYKIHEEIHPAKKSFALGITAIATSFGIFLSGMVYVSSYFL